MIGIKKENTYSIHLRNSRKNHHGLWGGKMGLPSAAVCVLACAVGTRVHNWAMTIQRKTSYAHKGMHVAAAVMVESAMEKFTDLAIVNEAKADLEAALNGQNYLKLFQ